MFDLIVIGGGPCGVMASIQALKNNKKVLLIDHKDQLLTKLKASGNGRCNVTNNKATKDFVANIKENPKYFYPIINQFPPHKIIEFFISNNVPLKEEYDNKMFPVSDSSLDIAQALVDNLHNVTLKLNTHVSSVSKNDDIFEVMADTLYQSKSLLIATGGKSYKVLGSDGSGYTLAQSLGHSITPLLIQECALATKDPLILLSGIALEEGLFTICDDKHKHYEKIEGPMLFTHFGLSGPAILNASFTINKMLVEGIKPYIKINLLKLSYEDTRLFILENINKYPKKLLKNSFRDLPNRLLVVLLEHYKLAEIPNGALTKEQIKLITSFIAELTLEFDSFYNQDYAFVTGGGVNIKELKPKTLESKLVENLYFGGEVLAVSAKLGGYNITTALACGYVIGNNIK